MSNEIGTKFLIAQRLSEESLRLKDQGIDLYKAGKVTERSQYNYEKGIRSPDGDYFAAIAAAGADVNYILTGQRVHLISEDNPGYTLRPDQKALLDNLDHCSPKDQDNIRRMALLAARAADTEEAQRKQNHNH